MSDRARLLDSLEALKREIDSLRETLDPLERRLAKAKREYDERLGPLVRAGRRLAAERDDTVAQLEGTSRLDFEPWSEARPGAGVRAAAPLSRERDPEEIAKDRLLQHLVGVLDTMTDEDEGDLFATLQGVCGDPGSTLADALEQLPWGRAWSDSPRDENGTAELERIRDWHNALEDRRGELRRGIERLGRDPRAALAARRERSDSEWEGFLEQAARDQENENRRLREEIEGIRQRLTQRADA